MSRSSASWRLAMIVGAAVALSPAISVADWNTGVGANAARTSLAPNLGPLERELLWQGSSPSLVAQQAVAAGDLLVVNRIRSFTIPTGDSIVAHSLATGRRLWGVSLPFASGDEWRSRATAIRDGHVYAPRSGGDQNPAYLYALEPSDGSIIWRSVDRIQESTTESAAFAEDGDLIIGNWNELLRIDKDDGRTVWRAARSTPTTDGCSAAVFGDRAYIWEPSASGPKVTAFNITTGTRLYSSAPIGGGYIQQVGLMVGPDGTIYAPRTQNNPVTDYFVALEDTGTALVERWRYPMGYTPFASFGVGPDGTVYTYSRAGEVVRLDPESGEVLDTSPPITIDFPFMPRIGIDSAGKVYLTNGGFSHGTLYAFNPDLTLRWTDSVPSVNLGGPVIGQQDILVVCGTGTDVRAYWTSNADVVDRMPGLHDPVLMQNFPNPFYPATEIGLRLTQASVITLCVFDAGGRRVRTLIPAESRPAGDYRIVWDGRDDRADPMPSGLYFYRLVAGGEIRTRRMLLAR